MTTALPVVPARVHSQKQQETVAVTSANVHTHGRKHSFRGFSTHSLSSLTQRSSGVAGGGAAAAAAVARHSAGASIRRSLFSFGGSAVSATVSGASTESPQKGMDDKDAATIVVVAATAVQPASRPPSLVTDNSSLGSISSRSPSPEPTSGGALQQQAITARLESAFKAYAHSFNVQILHTQLLPILARSGSTTQPPTLLLEDADIAFLFKWWHHLLLLSPPHPTVFVCVWALASHTILHKAAIWNAHYALTLSTLLAQDSQTLPTGPFTRLLALGYLFHEPTHAALRQRFAAKLSRRSALSKEQAEEVWCKRARQAEVFCEFLRQIHLQQPNYVDEDDILGGRLQQLLTKLLAVRSPTPNTRLLNCGRILAQAEGRLAVLVESSLQAVATKTRAFDPAAVFHLLDLLSLLRISRIDFWTDVLRCALDTENHIIQIRVFAYFYEHWPLYAHHEPACDLLLDGDRWQHYFVHWSGIVRDHYMRLLCYRLATTHPLLLRQMLKRTFRTSLQEHCQLRDCLPGNPIPNKKFAIRPCPSVQQQPPPPPVSADANGKVWHGPATPLALFAQQDHTTTPLPGALPPSPPQQHAVPAAQQAQGLDVSAAQFVKRKLGLFRGLWEDATPPSPPAVSRPTLFVTQQVLQESIQVAAALEARQDLAILGRLEDRPISLAPSPPPPLSTAAAVANTGLRRASPIRGRETPTQQRYRFVAEFVGKQWSLTGDADAIRFLDGVMDLAQNGRLPSFAQVDATSSSAEEDACEPFEMGEGRKRLWTRSLSEWSVLLDDQERFWRSQQVSTSSGTLVVPRLEVEFPRWFCQKSTTVRGDSGEMVPRRS